MRPIRSFNAPFAAPVLLGLLAGGCAQPRAERGPDVALVTSAVSSAAAQVKRCYRSPRVPTSGRRIITRLRVRYAADGSLAGLPTVISQTAVTPDNRPWAGRMAEAASLAVIRCSPVRLPPELHRHGWEELDLVFSPRLLAQNRFTGAVVA